LNKLAVSSMVAMFLFRRAGRSASLSLSLSLSYRYQCRTMKASGIASSRYLTSSSSSGSGNSNNPSEASKTSLANLNIEIHSKDSSTDDHTTKTAPLISSLNTVTEKEANTNTTTTSKDPPSPPTATKFVYIHPLSQIVLLLLQNECHEWITRMGLDGNLTVHRDGTFSLETASTTSNDAHTNSESESATARIWTAYDPEEKKHWLIYSSSTGGSDHSSSSADSDENPAATSTEVRHKFLMQDNLRTAWQKGTKNTSVPDRIHESVRLLMLQLR
jgi:hypothetical protein